MSRRPVIETVQHIIEIENWKLDYTFGIDVTPAGAIEYSDDRHLVLEGPIIEPKKITAKRGRILCFPQAALVGLERPAVVPTKETPPVGLVYYRGKEYTASFTFPSDVLPIIVQMLLARKYRHIMFSASKTGHEVSRFTFTDMDGDPDSRLSLLPR